MKRVGKGRIMKANLGFKLVGHEVTENYTSGQPCEEDFRKIDHDDFHPEWVLRFG